MGMQRLAAARITKRSSIWPSCRPTSQRIWMAQFRKLSLSKAPRANQEHLDGIVRRARVQHARLRLAQRLDEDDVLEYISGEDEEPLGYERAQGGGFYMRGLEDLGRYRMWLKIGFGKTSSVWVANDVEKEGFVAVKILSGNQTELNDYGVWQELEAHARIGERADEAKRSNCITLLDSFRIPALRESDGEHLCLVLPLMRANLDDVINPRGEPAPVIPMDVVKKVLRSVLKAIKFLHKNNIAHREITTRDVMITMDPRFDVAKWVSGNHHDLIVRAAHSTKRRGLGSLYSVHLPKPTMDELASKNTKFVLSDLGTARFVDQLPLVKVHTPLSLRPPETLLGGKWDQSVDIWNFGTMAYYLLTRKPLFSLSPTGTHGLPPPPRPPELKKSFEVHQAIPSSAEWLLYQMSSVCCGSRVAVGSFPKELLESWNNPNTIDSVRKRTRFFDEQGRLKSFTLPMGEHRKQLKLKRSSFLELLESTPVPMTMEERKDAAEFLRRCVRLNPKERASAAQLLKHRFLKA